MNENSNSSSLSHSLTPSEIVNVRDAALERIIPMMMVLIY